MADESVGKTNLVLRLSRNEFDENSWSSPGVNLMSTFFTKNHDNGATEQAKLQLWDAPGQKSLQDVTAAYAGQADVVWVAYDITNRDSFDNVQAVHLDLYVSYTTTNTYSFFFFFFFSTANE